MTPEPWPRQVPAVRLARPATVVGASTSPLTTPSPPRTAGPAIDWTTWLRVTERKRRLADGLDPRAGRAFWAGYYLAATDASFRLDGLILPPGDAAAALAPGGAAARAFRSRQQQRVRNHVAILRHLEHLLRRGATLKSADVVRWYTSVACGLSTTRLDEPTAARLDGLVRQINSPHLRLRPALQEIARLHRQMLADPVVPSFNGILARLLLRYHLGRCGLPPVLFDPGQDAGRMLDESRLLARLLELIHETYTVMLEKPT